MLIHEFDGKPELVSVTTERHVFERSLGREERRLVESSCQGFCPFLQPDFLRGYGRSEHKKGKLVVDDK
jgi:hypothetical protein